jgi:glycosyltransferase involved in cell wall biosynthesis
VKSICFVVATPFTANAFLLEHVKQLSLLYKVTLCLNLSLYPLSEDFDLKKVRVINIAIQRRIHPIKDIVTLFALFNVFRKEKFDAIHTVSPKAGLLGMLAAFFSGTKNRIHTFTGQIWATSNGLSKYFYKSIDRIICWLSTNAFADSQSQIDFLISEGVCKKNMIQMLGSGSISGVNLERFIPDDEVRREYRNLMGAHQNDIIFLFVGRICRDKGINDLLAAYEKIQNQVKERNYLWIVGPDEENITSLLRNRYPKLQNQITWCGPTNAPEKYMAAADILVLPSYREGFGNVVIEAAACKIPTIAYKTEGIVDAIEDKQTGLLANKYDIENLSSLMELLATNTNLRKNLGHNAYERVITMFSSKVVTAAWISFYQKILVDSN